MDYALTSLSLKRLIGTFFSFTPHCSDRRVILIYHSVGGGPDSVSPENFFQQMAWLHEHAIVEPLAELIADQTKPGLRVSLTFDDGYGSLYDCAAAILRRINFPATVFVNSSKLSTSARFSSNIDDGYYPGETFMTSAELRTLMAQGWTVGSHGVDHLDFTRLESREVHRQADLSRHQISDQLGQDCLFFCYPWGKHTSGINTFVAAAGYKAAVSSHHGSLKENSNPFALPRIDVRREYQLHDFIAAVSGAWDFIAFLQKLRGIN